MSFFAVLAVLPLALGALTAGTTYTISPSSHPDYCLGPASATEGAELVLKLCDTSSDIVFTLDGDNLKNTETNMCIDIRDGSNESGNLAQMWNCYESNPNQNFDVVGDEVKWVGKDKCLDLKDGLGAEGTEVQIWSCYGHNTNQRWTFTEAQEVDGEDEDCETESATSPSTPSATSTGSTPSTSADCEETDEEYEVEIPGDESDSNSGDSDSDSDESEVPYCDETPAVTKRSTVSETETLSRRGRGQLWQRSLDEEFAQLDERYIPRAPAGVPSAQRRSRRRSATNVAERDATATGL